MLKIALLLALVIGIQAEECQGECYLFGDEEVTSEAKAISYCADRNGYLAEINNQEELTRLIEEAKKLETEMNGFFVAKIWGSMDYDDLGWLILWVTEPEPYTLQYTEQTSDGGIAALCKAN